MSISSNELFHFTKVQYLKGILIDRSFQPRYNVEFVHFTNTSSQKAAFWAIPMVCFCDIPYELSKHHCERYGNVGIVMSEEWKLRKKLNPVIYLQSESYLAQSVSRLTGLDEQLYKIYEGNNTNRLIMESITAVSVNLNHLSYFIKQFENKFEEVEYCGIIHKLEKRRFYDEREWRYIPFELEKIGTQYIHLSFEDFIDSDKLSEANALLDNHKLCFDYSDIEYIIVESEQDNNEISSIIKDRTDVSVEIRLIES